MSSSLPEGSSEIKQYQCLRGSIAVRRHHDHGDSYKGNHLIEVVAYSFRGSVHYHHGREHGGMQADVVLET